MNQVDYNAQTSREVSKPVLNDESPDYEALEGELIEAFDERLRAAVDEDRYLPDAYSVAVIAMKIGLCQIEGSEKDAIQLRNQAWLENGKEEVLKENIIDEIRNELSAYNFEKLDELPAGEVLEFYQKINKCRE